MKTKTQKVTSALQLAYIYLYKHESCGPKYDAQRNLQGRTHYVDDDTLACFKARILSGGTDQGGLVYCLIESVNSRPNHGGYNKRFAVFDVFGTEVGDAREDWHRTSEQANKALAEFLQGFDAVKHTFNELKAKAKRDKATAQATLNALK